MSVCLPPSPGGGGAAIPPVQIPAPTKRKRGAPRGNRNRWKHGRYSAATRAFRAERAAMLAPLFARVAAALASAEMEIRFRDGFAAMLRDQAREFAAGIATAGAKKRGGA